MTDPDPTVDVTEPSLTVSWFQALDENGNPSVGITFELTMLRMSTMLVIPNSPGSMFGNVTSGGFATTATTATAVSDFAGIVRFPGTLNGATYEIRRPESCRKKVFLVNGLGFFRIPNFMW